MKRAIQRLGIVAELSGKRRGRVFSYKRYAEILNEGMGPPGASRS
jgi:hypothetical protein